MYLEKIAEDASRPQIMVDVETLGTTAGCAPIAIAAVAFNTSPGQSWLVDPRCWRINLRSAMSMGHHIDPDTLYWWVNKHPEMFQRLMRETEDTDGGLWHLGDALWDVSRFVDEVRSRSGEDPLVWARGVDFDFGMILRPAFKRCGYSLPWSFRDQRCMRGIAYGRPSANHHPLEDAKRQAMAVIEWYRVILGDRPNSNT